MEKSSSLVHAQYDSVWLQFVLDMATVNTRMSSVTDYCSVSHVHVVVNVTPSSTMCLPYPWTIATSTITV